MGRGRPLDGLPAGRAVPAAEAGPEVIFARLRNGLATACALQEHGPEFAVAIGPA
ncbi:hypothetical protein Sme01_04350 [Sphaerisporangium melleum]|uniref:Uncharacterized protein n=1 Tax=Sphaerisporangium melleum TaxID=321316 RepID=A0A917QPD3_9ACTN|nr:hypothetical protein GCM10007964_01900 [Sphaerisporangium melleum]GII67959.1 hypothetical protein Sme01_04350 [Sphaerisporangium melleum]